jgi:hypothetical protein
MTLEWVEVGNARVGIEDLDTISAFVSSLLLQLHSHIIKMKGDQSYSSISYISTLTLLYVYDNPIQSTISGSPITCQKLYGSILTVVVARNCVSEFRGEFYVKPYLSISAFLCSPQYCSSSGTLI